MTEKLLKTAKALEQHGFTAFVCETTEEAIEKSLSLLTEGCSITWGGSATIRDMGLTEAVKKGPYQVFDRDLVPPAERAAFSKEHYFSDWYFMSSNAVTEDGTLLNLDGNGNRVASLIFGPANVLVVAGANKITPDVNEAYRRVREVASPKNAQRFDIQTPCKKTGKCADCLSPDTICCSMVHTRYVRTPGRVTVILVNENLGY